MMQFGKGFLHVNAALFAVFGAGFIVAPAFFGQLFTGGVPATQSGLIDLRATYGGLSLGLAAFMFMCASREVRLGLRGTVWVLGAVIAGRVVGIVVDGSPGFFMYAFLVAETLFFALAVYALQRQPA